MSFTNTSQDESADFAYELINRGAFALLGDTGGFSDVVKDASYVTDLNIPSIGTASFF